LLATAREPGVLRSTIREVGWMAAHVALYPTGLGPGRHPETVASDDELRAAAEERRAEQSEDPRHIPVLLLHGMIDNRSIFLRLRTSLARKGFTSLLTMNYPVLTADLPSAAYQLAEVVERICIRTGYQRIHLVAHSMGGLVARYYVQRLSGDSRVSVLVTLATPHAGTSAAKLLPYGILRHLQPGAAVLDELAAPAPGCRTRLVSIYSDLDVMVLPATSGILRHPDLDVRNVLIAGAGHHTLPFDRRTVQEIERALCQDTGSDKPPSSNL
jgi:pimeloyl-ACP methyl ester carboxylesterase